MQRNPGRRAALRGFLKPVSCGGACGRLRLLLGLLVFCVGLFPFSPVPLREGEPPSAGLEAWPGPPPTEPPVPVRAVAGADVETLSPGGYLIREYLDIHNDDGVKAVQVRNVKADTWIGHRPDRRDEAWNDQPLPITVLPDSTVRVAERQRRIAGPPRRDWWIRWVRFRVETDRGEIVSNFVDSPMKPPSRLTKEWRQPEVDSLGSPGLPSPASPGTPGSSGGR